MTNRIFFWGAKDEAVRINKIIHISSLFNMIKNIYFAYLLAVNKKKDYIILFTYLSKRTRLPISGLNARGGGMA